MTKSYKYIYLQKNIHICMLAKFINTCVYKYIHTKVYNGSTFSANNFAIKQPFFLRQIIQFGKLTANRTQPKLPCHKSDTIYIYICLLIYLALAPKKRRLPGVTMPHPFPSWPSPPSDTAVSGRSDGLAVGSWSSTRCLVKTKKMRRFTPWKINMEPTNQPFRKENDLPNLHDYVPC